MAEDNDPTIILKMKRDFNQFVSGSTSQNSGLKFDLDQSLSTKSTANNSSGLSVRSLLGEYSYSARSLGHI